MATFTQTRTVFIIVLYGCAAQSDKWLNFGMKCYWFSSTAHTFLDAKTKCEGTGQHNEQLLHVINDYELSFCMEHLMAFDLGREYYVGIRRNSSLAGNSFTWADGSEPSSDLWGSSYPRNDPAKACVVFDFHYTSRQWKLYNDECDLFEQYICEMEAQIKETRYPNQLIAHKVEIKKIDEENQCFIWEVSVASRIECSIQCRLNKCDIYGYGDSDGSCSLYRIKSGACTTMNFKAEIQYYMTRSAYECPL